MEKGGTILKVYKTVARVKIKVDASIVLTLGSWRGRTMTSGGRRIEERIKLPSLF